MRQTLPNAHLAGRQTAEVLEGKSAEQQNQTDHPHEQRGLYRYRGVNHVISTHRKGHPTNIGLSQGPMQSGPSQAKTGLIAERQSE